MPTTSNTNPKHPASKSGAVANSQVSASSGIVQERFDDAHANASSETAAALEIIPRTLVKAAFDYVVATIALIVLAPLFLIVAIYIKMVSPGPVFFRHKRYGIGEKQFYVWKFRSMSSDTDPAAHAQYVQSLVDSNETLAKTETTQLIPLGGLIRDLGIDELPQLLNVVSGQMSLTGPRPDVFDPKGLTQRQRIRYQVFPGITGLWQISGKNETTFDEMIDLDVTYVQQYSFLKDLIILFATPIRIVSQFLPPHK